MLKSKARSESVMHYGVSARKDVRVTHLSASLLSRADVFAQLTRNEQQKKRAYLHRVHHGLKEHEQLQNL